jgi:hypothetical protein
MRVEADLKSRASALAAAHRCVAYEAINLSIGALAVPALTAE